jgi:hypothetical protein
MRVDEINRPGVRTTLAADADNDTSTGRHSIHQSRITGLRIDELHRLGHSSPGEAPGFQYFTEYDLIT